MSDEAVLAKTGKTWSEWFAILDAAGAKTMSHQEIVAVLSEKHKVGSWWRQMVTVSYEQARGLRELHQKPGGYSISVTKTIDTPVARLYKAWEDDRTRGAWLPETPFVIRKATANRSMRITWTDGKTNLDVGFFPKGDSKCQVAVQHDKLPNAKACEKMKKYWSQALGRLKEVLEG